MDPLRWQSQQEKGKTQPCPSKAPEVTYFPSLGQRRHCTHTASLGVKNEGAPPQKRWCPPQTSGLESLLEKMGLHVREGPRVGQVWKKKPSDCLRVSKDPEELPCVNGLAASFLQPSSPGGTPHPFSLACIAALLLSWRSRFSVCTPTGGCAVSLTENFIPAFTVFNSVRNTFFTEGKDPGKNSF